MTPGKDDGRSISRNVVSINKLVQDKTKLLFQNILQHGISSFKFEILKTNID